MQQLLCTLPLPLLLRVKEAVRSGALQFRQQSWIPSGTQFSLLLIIYSDSVSEA